MILYPAIDLKDGKPYVLVARRHGKNLLFSTDDPAAQGKSFCLMPVVLGSSCGLNGARSPARRLMLPQSKPLLKVLQSSCPAGGESRYATIEGLVDKG